jgi:hypothetical protein
MFERSKYLPPNAPTTYYQGILLPAMPKNAVTIAFHQYRPDQIFTLFPDHRNQNTYERDDRTVLVKVVRPLKVGYGNKIQTILCEIVDGMSDLMGSKVVLRCFDSLYVSPGLLDLIPYGNCCSNSAAESVPAKPSTWNTEADMGENSSLNDIKLSGIIDGQQSNNGESEVDSRSSNVQSENEKVIGHTGFKSKYSRLIMQKSSSKIKTSNPSIAPSTSNPQSLRISSIDNTYMLYPNVIQKHVKC